MHLPKRKLVRFKKIAHKANEKLKNMRAKCLKLGLIPHELIALIRTTSRIVRADTILRGL